MCTPICHYMLLCLPKTLSNLFLGSLQSIFLCSDILPEWTWRRTIQTGFLVLWLPGRQASPFHTPWCLSCLCCLIIHCFLPCWRRLRILRFWGWKEYKVTASNKPFLHFIQLWASAASLQLACVDHLLERLPIPMAKGWQGPISPTCPFQGSRHSQWCTAWPEARALMQTNALTWVAVPVLIPRSATILCTSVTHIWFPVLLVILCGNIP